MSIIDVSLIVLAASAVIIGGLYFLNRWVSKKQVGQQEIIERSKQKADIYVIDKKRDKAANATLPKAVMEGLPKATKLMKLCFVKVKVGPQIITMMCDKRVFEYLEPKKTYKAEIAGIYIVNVKGMKTAAEVKEAKKARKLKEKAEKRSTKEK